MKSNIQKFVLLIAAVAVIFTGCDDKENDPIVPTFSLDIVSVQEGSPVQVEILTGTAPFEVSPQSGPIATASVSGSTITIEGVSAGTVSVAVTGSDGGKANLAVVVNARPANAPVLSTTAVEVEDGGGTATVTISGGTPGFTATSDHPNIATATVDGTTVTVTGHSMGTTLIIVAGSDGATATFAVGVTGEQIFFGPDKSQIGNGDKSFYINESHTIKKGVYTMVGWIYVTEGATLTIEPGTIIKGTNRSYDGTEAATGSTLIIHRGAKIIADGTREEPIVFTSAQPKGQRQATDWGGIIICGRARNNTGADMLIEGGVVAYHGGTDDDDDSGIMRFVRLEFGGYPYAEDTEINGLTLGSVGRGTILEHIQVSYCGDDSFEWFGGSVNARYLVAYHGWDDDFDTDNGFSGKIQFALAVRDPKIADFSNSNGFESDNDNPGSINQPFTSAVFSNVTIIGPMGQDDNFSNTSGYLTGYNWGTTTTAGYPIKPGIFQAAMQIRRNSRMNCFNSVLTGFPVGLLLDKQRGDTHGAAERGDLTIKNVFMAGMGILGADDNSTTHGAWAGDFSANYFKQAGLNNQEFATIDELMLKDFRSKLTPIPATGYAPNNPEANWGPMAGSPLLNAANFDDDLLKDPFFDETTYVGAFTDDNYENSWLRGWTNFDPQNTDY